MQQQFCFHVATQVGMGPEKCDRSRIVYVGIHEDVWNSPVGELTGEVHRLIVEGGSDQYSVTFQRGGFVEGLATGEQVELVVIE